MKVVRDLVIIENKQLNTDNFEITLGSNEDLPTILPGQFVNVEINKSTETFLRRPFSILNVDYTKKQISLLVKILGRASKVFTTYKADDIVSTIFPLGNGFTMPSSNDKVLLIGGGSGVAPMLNIAKNCNLNKDKVHLLLGARTCEDHFDTSHYDKFGTIYKSSEDGSIGEKGYVTNHSIFKKLDQYTKVYSCGPEPMLKAIAKESEAIDIFCEVSLENMMACGFGVCLCCVEKTKNGNKCVCSDGPVFNIKELSW